MNLQNQVRVLMVSAILFFSIGWSAYYWDKLPPVVPTHFGRDGYPAGYGPKKVDLTMPIYVEAFVAAIYAAAVIVMQNRKYWARKFKKPVPEEVVQVIMNRGLRVVDWVVLLIMLLMVDVQVDSFQVALKHKEHMSNTLWVFMALLYSGIIFNLAVLFIEQRRATSQAQAMEAGKK